MDRGEKEEIKKKKKEERNVLYVLLLADVEHFAMHVIK